ncbi:MAG TPA: hypothetical protein VKQ27_01715 [Acetobacteraceae bacterium]|nr:hypothetical protein [Acetobacteraceae bacterium]
MTRGIRGSGAASFAIIGSAKETRLMRKKLAFILAMLGCATTAACSAGYPPVDPAQRPHTMAAPTSNGDGGGGGGGGY